MQDKSFAPTKDQASEECAPLDPIARYRSLRAPRVVGLMSGTSIDAIDAVLVEMGAQVKLLRTATHPLPSEIKARLHRFFANRGTPQEITELHWLLGKLFAKAALSVMQGGADLIASHGQTICHLPNAVECCGEQVRGTLQIGEGAVIAETTNCLTVCDFRPQDLAVGGQGAPLVPFADRRLFGSDKVDRIALNIGGMANITYIPRQGETRACDTGPGNAVSDALAQRYVGLECDYDGAIAAGGRVLPELLEELLRHPFLALPAPKSTGREEFGQILADSLWSRGEAPDLIRTALAFTAECISLHVQRFCSEHAEMLVGGGGVLNPVLMSELRSRLPKRIDMQRMDAAGIPAQAREAVAFAIMGHETVWGRPSNVPLATGATKKVVLGKIILP